MASYHIYLINNFSPSTKSQDYAIFNDLPKVSHNPSCAPLYSSVVKSTCLKRGKSWSVGLNTSLYAWCGVSDKELSETSRTEITSSKLVTLGTAQDPGSTLKLCNVRQPKFESFTPLSSISGAIRFITGNDFDRSAHFAYGLATVDDEGNLKSTISMTAASDASVDMVPSHSFYIGAQSCSTGTFIDSITASKTAARLDFSSQSNCFGAVVTHCPDGSFKVHYASAKDFAATVESETHSVTIDNPESLSEQLHSRNVEVAQLKAKLQQMQDTLNALSRQQPKEPFPSLEHSMQSPAADLPSALPVNLTTSDPYPAKRQSTWYEASFTFQNKPGQSRRRDLRDRLINYMQTLGYVYEGGSIDPKFVAIWSHDAGTYGDWHSAQQAFQDLRNVCQALPRHLKGYISSNDLIINRTLESKGLWRARGETESRVNEVQLRSSGSSAITSSASDGSDTGNSDAMKVNGTHGAGRYRNKAKRGSKSLPRGEKVQIKGQRPVVNADPVRSSSINNLDGAQSGNIQIELGMDSMQAVKERARAVLGGDGLDRWSLN